MYIYGEDIMTPCRQNTLGWFWTTRRWCATWSSNQSEIAVMIPRFFSAV